LGFAIRRLDQGVQRIQSDYDARLSKLEATTAALQAAAEAPSPKAAGVTADASKTAPVVTNLQNQTPSQSTPDTSVDTSGSPQDLYDRAFLMLRQTDYDNAEKAFRAFIDKNPKDKLIDNAKYWLAETLYARNRYADAAVAFADAFQQNPQGSKAPDSLLKLAMSLAATDKTADACVALGELKNQYPGASVSVRSRGAEEQSKLKCKAN
jgi:tol-pal system protein YbgF